MSIRKIYFNHDFVTQTFICSDYDNIFVLSVYKKSEKMDYIISCNASDLNYDYLNVICTNGSKSSDAQCIKYDDNVSLIVRYLSGGWFFVISVLGIFGNFMTLICIPFSSQRKLYGLDKNFKVSTIFILFVSFIDFWRCLLYSLPYSLGLLSKSWFFGTFWCHMCSYVLVITQY